MEKIHHDVLIVGAGLSGIAAAYHLQTSCPTKTFAILEGRDRLGGTWDLFRYPGARSDSDMYTLGYPFHPWTKEKSIASAPSILAYLRETAEAHGIDRKICYGRRVECARWSSKDCRWEVGVRNVTNGRVEQLTCGFLFVCPGYYDYDQGYTPDFRGQEMFRGRIVHPQEWPAALNYAGQRVVVIGSGATAVTIIPALAMEAAHVTMVQRSPSYILAMPEKDPVAGWLFNRLPKSTAYKISRWKNVLIASALYSFCRKLPKQASRTLIGLVRRQVGSGVDVETHFTPGYEPWDQRLCVAPDGDFFKAIQAGKVSVVTDHIESFTENGLRLRSGPTLEADIIVTATGLRLKFLGGIALEVDGQPIQPSATVTYKGMMFGDVPNLAVATGYTNASWTLKCDLICEYVCRLLRFMDARGYDQCCPRPNQGAKGVVPLLNLQSGYVRRASNDLPRQGSSSPWRMYQNYIRDLFALRYSRLDDGVLQFNTRDDPAAIESA
jgi:cation diffusion facilitator CzcD-associated flavoprotein CzcO